LGNVAVVIKKRSLLGSLDYIVTHGLALFGLIAGSLKAQIKDPRDYPLDIIEIADHDTRIGTLNPPCSSSFQLGDQTSTAEERRGTQRLADSS